MGSKTTKSAKEGGGGSNEEFPPSLSKGVPIFKLILVGDCSVGKSNLLSRFTDNTFTTGFNSTIGVDFKLRAVDLGGITLKLQIWDTAAIQRFRTITSSYYRGSHGVMVFYDITNRETFANIPHWLQQIDRLASKNVCKLMVGTKCDMGNERKVTTEEGQLFANEHNLKFIETSAKDCINVEEAFLGMSMAICRRARILLPDDANNWPQSHCNFEREQKRIVEEYCLMLGRKNVSRDVSVYCVKIILRVILFKQ